MVKMIATKSFAFASRMLSVGDKFNADDEQQATLLQSIGRATRVEIDEPSKRRFYRRRDMKASA